MTTNSIIQQCLDILKKEDIKHELRLLISPILGMIIYELHPYIYITFCLIFLIFIMILAILILLIFALRNKNMITKIF